MAIYSVYRYGTKSYDYYDDGKPAPTHASSPKSFSLGGIGESPDAAAWKLPIGAKKIGSGEMPRGRIASSGLGSFSGGDGVKLAGLGLAAYLAWRYLR